MEGWKNEQGFQVSELVKDRTAFVREQDPSLQIGEIEGKGSASVVYNCSSGEETASAVLKVSVMDEGIPKKESGAYWNLDGVEGIPRLLQRYWNKDIIVALLLEKITGTPLVEYLDTHEDVGSVILAMHKLVLEFHARGLQIPRDWLKSENWIVTNEGIPYLVDLGESGTLDSDFKEAAWQKNTNFASFNALYEAHKSRINKKDRKILEKAMDRAYRVNEQENYYGGNFEDR